MELLKTFITMVFYFAFIALGWSMKNLSFDELAVSAFTAMIVGELVWIMASGFKK